MQQCQPVYQQPGPVPSPYPPPPPQPVQYAQPLQQYPAPQPQYQQPAVQPAPMPQYYSPPAQPPMAPPVQQVQPPPPPRTQPPLPNAAPAGPPMAGGPFQGEAGAAAPGPIQQPPMAAPAAPANTAAGSGVEPMMEDALSDLLVFPDISDSIQKEFTIDGRPKSPRTSRPSGPSRRRSSMDHSVDRRRKERSHIRRSEDGSGSSQENCSGYSSPSQNSSAFQEVTRKPRKEKSAARPFLTDWRLQEKGGWPD